MALNMPPNLLAYLTKGEARSEPTPDMYCVLCTPASMSLVLERLEVPSQCEGSSGLPSLPREMLLQKGSLE